MSDKCKEMFNLIENGLNELVEIYSFSDPSFTERMMYRMVLTDVKKIVEDAYDEVHKE